MQPSSSSTRKHDRCTAPCPPPHHTYKKYGKRKKKYHAREHPEPRCLQPPRDREPDALAAAGHNCYGRHVRLEKKIDGYQVERESCKGLPRMRGEIVNNNNKKKKNRELIDHGKFISSPFWVLFHPKIRRPADKKHAFSCAMSSADGGTGSFASLPQKNSENKKFRAFFLFYFFYFFFFLTEQKKKKTKNKKKKKKKKKKKRCVGDFPRAYY
jgi:hypothetical protein